MGARSPVRSWTALGRRTEVIYTGQTGWLQGFRHGFIFDATLNDFVSGELEGFSSEFIGTLAREGRV